MTDASTRGWGNPGKPGSSTGREFYRRKIIAIEAGGRVLQVHNEVARLFKGFIDEITRRGYKINDGEIDDWGYNHRYIRGTTTLSNHSWGLAVDLNSRTNPQGDRLVTDMPSWVIECAERWGLYWGGNYKSRPDAMHFEFLGTPHDVNRYPLPTHEEEELTDAERKMLEAANHFAVVEAPKMKQNILEIEEIVRKILEKVS